MIYTKEHLKEISFPLGGIGSGSIGLAGNGRLVDFEIFNRPNKGGSNGYSFFAVRAVAPDGTVTARPLCGDEQKDLVGQYQFTRFRGFGYGPDRETMSGVRHFRGCSFDGRFPIAEITFTDPDFPLIIHLTAFNPLIPHHADDSSIPAAFFRITAENQTDTPYQFDSTLTFRNPFPVSRNASVERDGVRCIRMLHAGADPDDISYGDLTVACSDPDAKRQTYWYRGKWQDGIDSFWRSFSAGKELTDRRYDTDGVRDHCVIGSGFSLAAGEQKSIDYVVAWNIPNNYNHLIPYRDENGRDITWKNYYAKLFPDSVASASYAIRQFDRLYTDTLRFRDTLYASSLDEAVIESAASNLAVLKSSTVWRLEDGSFYGFEGTHEHEGSCDGTCQHVWNYAYALCFLFPDLERSIHELELTYAMEKSGKMKFRLPIPPGRSDGAFENSMDSQPCVDGQMGTILKIYRDWKLTGDDEWLEAHFEKITRLLEYVWSEENPGEWDRDRDGLMEGRQHNTLDIQLFGPSSWMQGFYLGALKATAEMAEHLGYTEKAAEYRAVYENGKKLTDELLFNGRYFIQKVDITDKSITDHFGCSDFYWNSETGEIKYQIGEGSSIDQLCGQWHADISGLGNLFDPQKIRTALGNIMKYNFKSDMRGFDNLWRIYALNDESGTVICSWPDDVKMPVIPSCYHSECWTGTEYEFAGLLAKHGMVDDALRVTRAVLDRYNGANRNPYSQLECGSNYARSMSSFALIPLFSGFLFDLPHNTVGFSPAIPTDPFRCFWATGNAWGEVEIRKKNCTLNVMDGVLRLEHLFLPFLRSVSHVVVDGKELPFTLENKMITFPCTEIQKTICIT